MIPGDDDKAGGTKDSPAGDARVDGAEADESGYRRDDYWREESGKNPGPSEVPEPPQGYAFEEPEEKAGAKGRAGRPDDDGDDDDAGQPDRDGADGRGGARLVDDGD